MRRSALPLIDLGLAALAAAVWYARPDAGAWPLLLIALGWLVRFLGSGRLTQPTPFDVPLLLFLASALVAAAIGFNQDAQWTDGPTPLLAAWAKYWYVVAGAGLFFAIANLGRVDHLWRFAQAYALLAAVVAAYFVVSNDWTVPSAKFNLLSQLGATIARPLGSLPGHRLNPNVAGGIIAMVLPFFAPLWHAARGRLSSLVFWSAAALVALFGLLLSESRGAWLALAVASGFWIAGRELTAWRKGLRGRVRKAVSLALLLGLGALVVAVVLAGRADLGAVAGPATDPLPGAGFPRTSTVISRLGLLQGGWVLAQDYLFTGAGLGTTPWVLSTYYLLIPVYFTAHTHNMFLDVLIEQGLPGFIPFGVVLVLAIGLALRALRTPSRPPDSSGVASAPEATLDAAGEFVRAGLSGFQSMRPSGGRATVAYGTAGEDGLSPDPKGVRAAPASANSPAIATVLWHPAGERSRWLLEAALVSLCVMALHGLVDDVAYNSRALVLLFVPAALIAALQPSRPLRVPRWALRGAAIGIALLALLAAWQRNSLSAAVYANAGALAQTQIELARYRVPDRLPEQMRRSADLSDAIGRFGRALALDAGNRTANQRMGEIALARGQYEPARDYLEAAYQRDPASEANWQLLGDAYLALGRADDAFALWSRVPEAPARLELEAVIRFEPVGDHTRARQAQDLAARIRTERTRSHQD